MKLEHESDMLVAEIRQVFLAEACHVDVVNLYRSSIGAIQGTDDLQESGLSGTTGSHDAYYFALADVQVDAFQHLQ